MSAATGPDGAAGVQAEPGSGHPDAAVEAGRSARTRVVVSLVVAVVLLVAAAWCLREGVATDTWPAFLPDTDSTQITRYEGPWLTAAAVALLGAGLAVMAAVRNVRGRRER